MQDLLSKSPFWSWLFAAGIVWGPGLLALHLQHNGVVPAASDQPLTVSQKSQDVSDQ